MPGSSETPRAAGSLFLGVKMIMRRGSSYIAFLLAVFVGVFGASPFVSRAAGTPSPTPTATPFPGLLVYIFTFSAPTDSSSLSADRKGIEDSFVSLINSGEGPYRACDKKSAGTQCSVDDAAILLYGSTSADNTVVVNARENVGGAGGSWLGSLTLASGDKIASLGADRLAGLLGGVTLISGKLSPVPGGYQQFVQLVPENVSATDPDYSGLLAFLLSQRGVVAYKSSFTLGAVGSNTATAFCAQGAEYLVYRLNITTVAHPLIGYTRVGVGITGNFINCNDTGSLAAGGAGFSGEARTNIPTTNASALVYSSLLKVIFPALGWTTIALGTGTASGFVDQKPDSLEVRSAVGESALRNLVNHFCATRPPVGIPSPSASPVAQTPALRLPGQPGAASAAASTSGAAAPSPVLDPGSAAIGPSPYVPACHDAWSAPTN